MQITFDPTNREEVALIRQLFRSTVEAPPTEEKQPEAAATTAAPAKRGRPAAVSKDVIPATPAEIATVQALPAPAALTTPVETKSSEPVQPLYTVDEVRAKLTYYAGAADEATAKALLLKEGGVVRLSEVPPAKYGQILKAIADAVALLPKKG